MRVTAAAALLAALVPLLLARVKPEQPDVRRRLLDFRPVLANRRALAYVLGYGVHCWELFAMRSWLVAFLAFSLAARPDAAAGGWLSPTSIATVAGLVAMAASIGGNELCVRFGRRRVVSLVMAAGVLCAAGFGFTAGLPYAVVAALALGYAAVVQLDFGGADRRRAGSGASRPARRDACRPRPDRLRLRRHRPAGTGHGAGRHRRRRYGPLLGPRLRVAGLVGLLGPLAMRIGRPPT